MEWLPDRLVASVSALLGGILLLAVAIPAVGISETWTDEFNDLSLTASHEGVVFSGGSVRLAPSTPQRQGRQLGAASSLLSPSVTQVGSLYYIYYANAGGGFSSIALATSTNASDWTPQGVVISPGLAGPTDSTAVAYEDVLVVGSTFHMWYSGADSSGSWTIHHATSSNGLDWTSGGVAISANSEGVSGSVYDPSVLWDGAKFTMWFTHSNGVSTWIRKASSTDGISWISEGIVLSPTAEETENLGPRMPDVVRDGTDYVMWYSCVGISLGQICRARSVNGTYWTREGVIIPPDPSLAGENDGVGEPSAMLLSKGNYRVWYLGRGSGYPDGIYSALVTGRYRTVGSLISVSIVLPSNLTWLSASLNRTTPSGTSATLTVRDATTGLAIGGYSNLTTTAVSLLGINPLSVPRIALQAWLSGSGADTPTLDNWSVTFGTLPPHPPSFWDQYQLLIILILLGGVGAVSLGVIMYAMRRPARRPPSG